MKYITPTRVTTFFFILISIFLIINSYSGAQASDSNLIISTIETLKYVISQVVSGMSYVLFYEILGFPLLVLWLVTGGVYFTIRLGFVNIRMFKHAIIVVTGKYSSDKDPGEVTHFQALSAAVSATVGLGNIAGVAIAVAIGGPGAVVWMMIAGFFGMSAKFAEVTLGQKYRKIDKNGKVSGGAFHYLEDGLAEMNLPKLGKILAFIFAVFCIGGALGGGNLFQANQAIAIVTDTFGFESVNEKTLFSVLLAFAVGVVLIGGIKRIAHVAEAIVPLMAFIYIVAGIVVIASNYDKIGEAFAIMFSDAFTGSAVGGGILGALITGFKRAAFSNEAGLGSAPIAHSAAKTKEPIREGCVALLEPFIDTMVICLFTGIIITITGVYSNSSESGVILTSNAFATVIDWFPMVLSIAVLLFAYSTMISWSYYGERSWEYLFGKKYSIIYHITFCLFVFIGGILSNENLDLIINFSDLLILSMAIPNLIGVYILSGMVKRELDKYIKKLKKGEFKVNP